MREKKEKAVKKEGGREGGREKGKKREGRTDGRLAGLGVKTRVRRSWAGSGKLGV
jgi:hypothetical protein